MESAAINGARWVVGKALSPLSGGLVEAWAATTELEPNIKALKMELLNAQAILHGARRREIDNPALVELLQMLRGLGYLAEDALDELDYFRIQDELEETFEAVDDLGCARNLLRNVRHAATTATRQLGCASFGSGARTTAHAAKLCCASCLSTARGSDEESDDESSKCVRRLASRARTTAQAAKQLCCASCLSAARGSDEESDEDSSKCLRQLASRARTTAHALGKRFLCSLHVRDDSKHVPRVPKLKFDRVDVSTRMKCIADQLKPLCAKVSTILGLELSGSVVAKLDLLGSSRGIGNAASTTRAITTSQALEPTLYGRDPQKNTIVEDITNGDRIHRDLTVIPIVGPGGIGKTALTQYIYNSKEVQDHFQIRAWVCVSLDFSVYKLTREIASCIPNAEDEKNDKPDNELPVTCLEIVRWTASGKELTRLISHLPELSRLIICDCDKITRLGVEAEQKQKAASLSMPASSIVKLQDTHGTSQQEVAALEVEEQVVAHEVAAEQQQEDGLLLLPANLSISLKYFSIMSCPKLILTAQTRGTGGGGLQAMRSLENIEINYCPKFLSAYKDSDLSSCCPFPSSLQELDLGGRMEGMDTLVPLSNLTSLQKLTVFNCGKDFRCEGLLPLSTQCQLTTLEVGQSPNFFAGWDPAQELQGGQEQPSSKLQELETDDIAGVLALPICRLLAPSLTKLSLDSNKEVERFTKQQEEALSLLTSLQELQFRWCNKLRCLPAGLHKLTNLKRLGIYYCLAIRSLPKNGLPSSLQVLHVIDCGNQELKQRCRRASQAYQLRQLKGHGCVQPMQSAAQGDIPSSLKELDVSGHGNLELKQQ
ncbi:hypothetical protein ACQ4PT_029747 [Festuca glaucescens]